MLKLLLLLLIVSGDSSLLFGGGEVLPVPAIAVVFTAVKGEFAQFSIVVVNVESVEAGMVIVVVVDSILDAVVESCSFNVFISFSANVARCNLKRNIISRKIM